MPRLPFRKRRSTLGTVKDVTLGDLAKLYTALKLSQPGAAAARRAAQGYAGLRAAKAGGREGRRIPGLAMAAAGILALIAFVRRRNRQPPGYAPPSVTADSSPPHDVSDPGITVDTPPAAGTPEAPKSGTSTAQTGDVFVQEGADASAPGTDT